MSVFARQSFGYPVYAIVYMTNGLSCIGQLQEARVAGQPLLEVACEGCENYDLLINLAHVQLIRLLPNKKTLDHLLTRRDSVAPCSFAVDDASLERIASALYEAETDDEDEYAEADEIAAAAEDEDT
jgi:hypothetical protein